ncbi:MAG TPA: hypothetical protein VLT36_15545 [Candidatus Dormibacteraeota bacterium]|nr:hypothetical protein [Candidatus Dormibacteraeota bacterium]
MKLIVCLVGLSALLTMTGCDWDHDHHHHHEGGAYNGYYQGYGHEAAPYDNHWEHRDYRY